MSGKEAMLSILTIDDIKSGINQSLVSILERHNCDLPTWEHTQFVIENKRWGDFIILTSDLEDDNRIIKYVRILGESLFKVDTHIRKENV